MSIPGSSNGDHSTQIRRMSHIETFSASTLSIFRKTILLKLKIGIVAITRLTFHMSNLEIKTHILYETTD